MIAPRTVVADAIVRNHSGETFLDWDGVDARQTKHYLADPQRLRQATTRLAELGFTVLSIGQHSLSVEASPERFLEAFGVTPIYGPGIGSDDTVRWRPPGGSSDPVIRLAASSELGGAIGALIFSEPAQLLRDIAIEEVDTRTNTPLPTDLLLGEAGQSLRQHMPDRIQQGAAFPANVAAILSDTKQSIKDWQGDLTIAHIRNHLADLARAGGPGARGVDAVILECRAEPNLKIALDALDLAVGARLVEPKTVYSEDAIYGIRAAWGDGYAGRFWADATREFLEIVAFECDRVLELGRTLRERVGLRRLWIQSANEPGIAQGEGINGAVARMNFVQACKNLSSALDTIPTRSAEAAKNSIPFTLSIPQDWLPSASGSPGSVVPQVILDINSELSKAITLDKAMADWDSAVQPVLTLLAEWKQGMLPDFLERRAIARHWMFAHYTMVTVAFRAASASLIELNCTVASHALQSWPKKLSSTRNTVTSISRGWPFGLDDDAVAIRRNRLAADGLLERSNILHVIAAGNKPFKPSGDDSPSKNASFAEVPNVLLVGGCHPTATGKWLASSATHGYSFTTVDPVKGSQMRFVPDLCATTNSGTEGGAVVFPVVSFGTATSRAQAILNWRYGAGSSLSAPLVAALCSLVWSCYPELSAAELKTCVLDSAVPLDGGDFHYPRKASGLKLDQNSNVYPGHKGARRPVLEPAIRKAEEAYRAKLDKKGPFRQPVLPPRWTGPLPAAGPAVVPAPAPQPPVPVKSGGRS